MELLDLLAANGEARGQPRHLPKQLLKYEFKGLELQASNLEQRSFSPNCHRNWRRTPPSARSGFSNAGNGWKGGSMIDEPDQPKRRADEQVTIRRADSHSGMKPEAPPRSPTLVTPSPTMQNFSVLFAIRRHLPCKFVIMAKEFQQGRLGPRVTCGRQKKGGFR